MFAMKTVLLGVFFLLALTTRVAWADEPETGNQFECIQHALASEGLRQPPAALLDMARVLRDKGACFRDPSWLTGWGVAQRHRDSGACLGNHHCRAYFFFETFDAELREPLAVAAHVALTEQPPVRRYHFDAARAPLVWWWSSRRACPNGFWVIGDMRIC
jgi:hypothetical protein